MDLYTLQGMKMRPVRFSPCCLYPTINHTNATCISESAINVPTDWRKDLPRLSVTHARSIIKIHKQLHLPYFPSSSTTNISCHHNLHENSSKCPTHPHTQLHLFLQPPTHQNALRKMQTPNLALLLPLLQAIHGPLITQLQLPIFLPSPFYSSWRL